MKRLNKISKAFVTELIDIITPETQGIGIDSKKTAATYSSFDNKTTFLIEDEVISLCLVLDYMDTDLDQIMKKSVPLKESNILKIIYNLLSSLCFLHKCNVMHRDLKCANILVNTTCGVKICDFGLSRSIPESSMGQHSLNSQRIRQCVG
jgi:serine/threonine protein kinase